MGERAATDIPQVAYRLMSKLPEPALCTSFSTQSGVCGRVDGWGRAYSAATRLLSGLRKTSRLSSAPDAPHRRIGP